MKRLEFNTPHLYERSGAYYFRRVVPKELRKLMHRREWQYSIGRKAQLSTNEAKIRARELTKATDETLNVVRHRIMQIAEIEREIKSISLTLPDVSVNSSLPVEETGELLSEVYRYVEAMHPVQCEKHRALAVRHFIQIMGDENMLSLKRRAVLEFITKYSERGYSHATLRRRIGALAAIIAHFYRDHDVSRNNPFRHAVKYAGPAHSIEDRAPLSDQQIRQLISFLRSNEGIPPYTKSVFWLIITTGAAPSEASGIVLEDLSLTAERPHVWIQENSVRGLKSICRRRRLPLIGAALRFAPSLADRTCNPISSGATLNKILKQAVSLKTKQSLYSIRHWMADRLRCVGATELEAKYILGHSRTSTHERYGSRHLDLLRLRELLVEATSVNEPSHSL